MNLFESLNNIIDQEFLDKLKSNTSDDLGDLDTAVRGVFYTLVAGLIRRSNSDMSAGMLFNQLNDSYKKTQLPDDWKSKLNDKVFVNKIMNDGTKIISQIFPAYKSPLLSMIGSYAGTSKNTTVLVSGMTAVQLVDFLGKLMKSEKWDKEQLVYFLKQHHEALLKDAPESLMEKMVPALGLQELVNSKIVIAKKPEPSSKNSSQETEILQSTDNEESIGIFFNKKVLIGLLIVGLLAMLGYFYWVTDGTFGIKKSDDTAAETVEDELFYADSLNNVPPAGGVVTDTVQLVKDSTIISLGNNSDQELVVFQQYVNNANENAGKVFDFKSIQYLDKTFDLTSQSNSMIEKIATEMKANKNLQIKITAFSEEGDLKLNNKRAFAVKKVLIGMGIDPIKIDATSGGKGGNYPKIRVVSK
jgi:outer membrane protein OmpA-like peptidoglycan-associated protein